MTTLSDAPRASSSGPAPRRARPSGRIRALVASALGSLGPAGGEAEKPERPPTRDEAVIAAARSALGGTIIW